MFLFNIKGLHTNPYTDSTHVCDRKNKRKLWERSDLPEMGSWPMCCPSQDRRMLPSGCPAPSSGAATATLLPNSPGALRDSWQLRRFPAASGKVLSISSGFLLTPEVTLEALLGTCQPNGTSTDAGLLTGTPALVLGPLADTSSSVSPRMPA